MQSLTYVILRRRAAPSRRTHEASACMSAFVLPDLGEGLQEAELVAWHVGEGDHVVADQPLVSVETEKAVVEVPSPQDGKIARLCVQPGERSRSAVPSSSSRRVPGPTPAQSSVSLPLPRRIFHPHLKPRRSRQRRRSALWRSGSGSSWRR